MVEKARHDINGFRLSKRDPYILKAVNDCQALTVEQLITIFWNSPNPAYTRLRKLCKFGYLAKNYITQITSAPSASQIIYTIAKKGASVLYENFGYTRDDINFISRQVKNWQSFQPIKATNDIRVSLMRACANNEDFELREWLNEASFRSNPDKVFVKGKATPVYPDGFCIITKGQAVTYNFVEADSGAEGLKQVESQMRIYQEYANSGLYEQTFGTKFWRVLFVTNSQRRIINLKKRIVNLGGGANFWLTTFDQISVDKILTEPIWMKANSEELQKFI